MKRTSAKSILLTHTRKVENGFTLIETLVAMSLVGAVLLPSCLWFYQSRTSRAAMEKFRATQILETRMNRAVLLRQGTDWGEEIPEPGYLRIEIHPKVDGSETRLLGTAKDRKGRIVTQLQAGFFGGIP
jgi:prepilin-type N-terminal cleavage/methylation domain-containing protein